MTGEIKFDTVPQKADLYIEDDYMGQTPIDIQEVDDGKYKYKLSLKDFEDYSGIISVEDNKIVQVIVNFQDKSQSYEYTDIELISAIPQVPQTIHDTTIPDKTIQPSDAADQQDAFTTEELQQEFPGESPAPGPPPEPAAAPTAEDFLSQITDLLTSIDASISKKELKAVWYVNEATILTSVITTPDDPSSSSYQFERIYDALGHNSEEIYICNDGPGLLFIVSSNDGIHFSKETRLYEGECKDYINVHTIGLRSPTTGLAYRISERYIEPHRSERFSGSRYGDRRDSKGTVVFKDDYESPTVKYNAISFTAPDTVQRNNSLANSGDFSLKMTVSNGNTSSVFYAHPDVHFERVGLQISWAFLGNTTNFFLSLHMHRFVENVRYHGEVFLQGKNAPNANADFGTVDVDGTTHVLVTDILTPSTETWHSLKLVVDYGSKFYSRAVVDGVTHDLSKIPLQINPGASILINELDTDISIQCVNGCVGTTPTVWIDDYILTEDEPPI